MKIFLLVSIVSFGLFPSALAATYVVDQQGGGDFLTIQAAVNVAANGDAIDVCSGIYYENVVFPNPAHTVYLRGEDPATTIIDAGGLHKCILIVGGGQGEVSGFTFQNSGTEYSDGIANCGIAVVTNGNGEWLIRNNIIRNHPELGILSFDTGVIENNLIENCDTGIFVSSDASLTIRNNTLTQFYTGIFAHWHATSCTAENNIFYDGFFGVQNFSSGWVSVGCNCFWDVSIYYLDAGPGEGDLVFDPLFCAIEDQDYTLQSNSPCAPDNHPNGNNCGLIGAYIVSCGPVSTTQENWGSIKAMFR